MWFLVIKYPPISKRNMSKSLNVNKILLSKLLLPFQAFAGITAKNLSKCIKIAVSKKSNIFDVSAKPFRTLRFFKIRNRENLVVLDLYELIADLLAFFARILPY